MRFFRLITPIVEPLIIISAIFGVELSTMVVIMMDISAGIFANALISFAVADIPESLLRVTLAKF